MALYPSLDRITALVPRSLDVPSSRASLWPVYKTADVPATVPRCTAWHHVRKGVGSEGQSTLAYVFDEEEEEVEELWPLGRRPWRRSAPTPQLSERAAIVKRAVAINGRCATCARARWQVSTKVGGGSWDGLGCSVAGCERHGDGRNEGWPEAESMAAAAEGGVARATLRVRLKGGVRWGLDGGMTHATAITVRACARAMPRAIMERTQPTRPESNGIQLERYCAGPALRR